MMSGNIFLESTQISIGEADGSIAVGIIREVDLSQPVTVEYQITLDTAQSADVSTLGVGQVVIPAGVDRVTVDVGIVDDALSESAETVIASIVSINSGTLTFPRTTRIDILDDENSMEPPADPPLESNYSVTESVVIDYVQAPIALEFSPVDPDLVYVGRKRGWVELYNAETGEKVSTVFNLDAETNSAADRGLLDIALHPNFPEEPYFYHFRVVDPPETAGNSGLAGQDGSGNRFAHLTRIELDPATNYRTMMPGSEVVLLGAAGQNLDDISGGGALNFTSTDTFDLPASEIDPVTGDYKQDYLKVDSQSHAGGSLEFGPDGMLYVSVGDGTSFNAADPRALSVQDVGSLSGKILRIDPMTGNGLPDNPFVDEAGGDLTRNEAKVYQLGFRNPFAMSFDAEGKFIISNTGWGGYESIFSGSAGANFGWPYYEGGDGGVLVPARGYEDFETADAFYAAVNAGEIDITPPYRAFSHVYEDPGYQVQGIAGSDDLIDSDALPESLQGYYIFADFVEGEVFAVSSDDRREIEYLYTSQSGLAPIHFKQGPDGSIYFVDVFGNYVGRYDITEPSAPVEGVSFDYNGDGFGDLLFRNDSSGTTLASSGPDGTLVRNFGTTSSGIVAIGDFDGDGATDIVVRNTNETMVSRAGAGGSITGYGNRAGETLLAAADFDGDGSDDLLFRDGASDSVEAVDGAANQVIQSFGTQAAGAIEAVGDFDGDGVSDLLLRNPDGTLTSASGTGGVVASYGNRAGETLLAIADFDGQGGDDLLIRRNATGATFVIDGSDNAFIRGFGVTASGAVKAVGDLDGDGATDVVLENSSSVLIGLSGPGGYVAGYGNRTNQALLAVADFDGNGADDLLLRNNNGGATFVIGGSDAAFKRGFGPTNPGAVEFVGDLDSDGVADVAIRNANGSVWGRSGTDGAVAGYGNRAGQEIAFGEMTLDLLPDGLMPGVDALI
ncbi:PQQ-dependent sugar dehydrogenase [Amaricoccus macauensis]|uniref:PQQ-dependent sugar dehydrogenase n=1 Tax=Amaricoccus macauensis TaxID=57001 RepID=UPI003C7B926F